jgi:hypothetical protein
MLVQKSACDGISPNPVLFRRRSGTPEFAIE